MSGAPPRPLSMLERLLEQVRKASLPGVWSQGVKLARERLVDLAAEGAGERTLRVRAPGLAVAPTVTLYFDEGEWSCDCGGRVDPCAHVAAAAIAAAAGEAAPEAAPARSPAGLVYRLDTRGKLLSIERVVAHPDGREVKLAHPLSSLVARGGLPFAPTHEDLRIDRLLGSAPRDVVPAARVVELLLLFAASNARVTYRGEAVRVADRCALPRAVVEDAPGGGFVLRLERDPAIEEVVAYSVGRAKDVLWPLGETETTGELLERLPLVRSFPPGREGELVTEVLAELEGRLPVEIVTGRLPRRSDAVRPRISLDLTHHGHTLSVLPTLVYGDPPLARVHGEELVLLGEVAPMRRRDEERELLTRLRDELNLVPGRRVDLDGSEAIRFASRLRAWHTRQGELHKAKVLGEQPLHPRLSLEGDAFDLAFECEGEGGEGARRADAAAVLRAFRDGLDLVPLEGGGWARLPVTWLEEHGHRLADLLAARDKDGRVATASLPDLGALCEALDAPPPPGLSRLAPLLHEFSGIPRAELPADLTASLRPYQAAGVDWLAFLRDAELGAVLADDMGLGKTLQALAALAGRSLVVSPRSVVYNWMNEIARFRPGLKVSIYDGARRELDPAADVTLTTYAILRLDAERLASVHWDAVVLDEAQAIKNETSQTARAAFSLRARFRVALSGTPIENRLEELWSVMHFANPGLLGGRSDFQGRHAAPIAAGDEAAAARLRAKIRPFVLRRMKREVLRELPPRTEAVLHVELDERERAVYDAVRLATRREVVERLAGGGSALQVLEALLRLRQAACHAALVPGQEAETSSKVERLVAALEEVAADGHRALVFSQWTSFLDLVEPHLREAGLDWLRLDGATRDRAGVVARFQDEAGPPVLLASLKAGGTGLNLTAADHVFLLDPWWNPAVEDQAADRAHRIGQERPVLVYRMVTRDTVEERVLSLKEKKRALAEAALGEAGGATSVTREDLLALLA